MELFKVILWGKNRLISAIISITIAEAIHSQNSVLKVSKSLQLQNNIWSSSIVRSGTSPQKSFFLKLTDIQKSTQTTVRGKSPLIQYEFYSFLFIFILYNLTFGVRFPIETVST